MYEQVSSCIVVSDAARQPAWPCGGPVWTRARTYLLIHSGTLLEPDGVAQSCSHTRHGAAQRARTDITTRAVDVGRWDLSSGTNKVPIVADIPGQRPGPQ